MWIVSMPYMRSMIMPDGIKSLFFVMNERATHVIDTLSGILLLILAYFQTLLNLKILIIMNAFR